MLETDVCTHHVGGEKKVFDKVSDRQPEYFTLQKKKKKQFVKIKSKPFFAPSFFQMSKHTQGETCDQSLVSGFCLCHISRALHLAARLETVMADRRIEM